MRFVVVLASASFALVGCASAAFSTATHVGPKSATLAPRPNKDGAPSVALYSISSPSGKVSESFYPGLGFKGPFYVTPGKWYLEVGCEGEHLRADGELITQMFVDRAPELVVSVRANRSYELFCRFGPHGLETAVQEISLPSNQPLHPDALTRAGERRR